jgi:L-ascorbate metabolism protein UlaG (beta-lactamase superfamily)
MNITYYGHSCFGVEINGKHLLFDPFISPNELAQHIDINAIPADYILISHGHEDHIADVELIAKRTGAQIICSYEIFVWLGKRGIENIHPMNIGGKVKLDFGNVKCVVAIHSSGLPDGSYGGSPMGFVIESSEGNFYYAGDTALTYDMKLIGDYRQIDFAFLPIGDNFSMGVDNAMIACDFINCNNVIGMHYDTFGYIKIDKSEAVAKFTRQGKKLTLLEIGETIQK